MSAGESQEPQASSFFPDSLVDELLGRGQESTVLSGIDVTSPPPPPPPSPPRHFLRRVDGDWNLRHRHPDQSYQHQKEVCDEQVKLALHYISAFDVEASQFTLWFGVGPPEEHRYYRYVEDVQPYVHKFYHVLEKYRHRYLGTEAITGTCPEPTCADGQWRVQPSTVVFEKSARDEAALGNPEATCGEGELLNEANPGVGGLDSLQNRAVSANPPTGTTTGRIASMSAELGPIPSPSAGSSSDPKRPDAMAEENMSPRSTSTQRSDMTRRAPWPSPPALPWSTPEGCTHPRLTPQALEKISAAIRASTPILHEVTEGMHRMRTMALVDSWLFQSDQRFPSTVDNLTKTTMKETAGIAAELGLDLMWDPYSDLANQDFENEWEKMSASLPSGALPSWEEEQVDFVKAGESSRSGGGLGGGGCGCGGCGTNANENDDNKPVATHHEHAAQPGTIAATLGNIPIVQPRFPTEAAPRSGPIHSAGTSEPWLWDGSVGARRHGLEIGGYLDNCLRELTAIYERSAGGHKREWDEMEDAGGEDDGVDGSSDGDDSSGGGDDGDGSGCGEQMSLPVHFKRRKLDEEKE